MNPLSSTLASTLATLRDVDGVVGSFVVDDQANVVAADLPAFFDAAALALAAPRLRRLSEALALKDEALQQCTLRFASHRLWLQPGAGVLLCVLAPIHCNLAALRMGATLVCRRVADALKDGSASMSASALGSSAALRREDVAAQSGSGLPTPSASSSWWRSRVPGASAPKSGARRQFRGRTVDGE